MKVIVVIGLDIADAEDLPRALEHINPPSIPYFDGQIRVAMDEPAIHVINWLDGDDETGTVVTGTSR